MKLTDDNLIDTITNFDKYIDSGMQKTEILDLLFQVFDLSLCKWPIRDISALQKLKTMSVTELHTLAFQILLYCTNKLTTLFDPTFLSSLEIDKLEKFHTCLRITKEPTYRYFLIRTIIPNAATFSEQQRAAIFKQMLYEYRIRDRDTYIELNEFFRRKIGSLSQDKAEFRLTSINTFTNYDFIFGNYEPPERMKSIPIDDPSTFRISMDISGRRMSKNVLLYLIQNNAETTICDLLQTSDSIERIYSPAELLFLASAKLPDALAIKFINILESKHPGVCEKARDLYGNNALWYTLYRVISRTPGNHDDYKNPKEVAQALLAHRCDPDHHNCLQLSYASIINS